MLNPCWIHAESMLNPCWIHVGFVLNSSLCAAMAPVLIAPCCCRCIRCLGFLFSSQGFRRSDLHVRAQSASIINAIRWDCCYFSHVIAVNGASVSYCWEGFSSDTGHVLLIDLSVLFVILFAVGLIHGVSLWRGRRNAPLWRDAKVGARFELLSCLPLITTAQVGSDDVTECCYR